MSLALNGKTVCDRCGDDCGNGSLDMAAIVSDLERNEKNEPVPGMIRVMHLCRANGCANRVLTTKALANRNETSP